MCGAFAAAFMFLFFATLLQAAIRAWRQSELGREIGEEGITPVTTTFVFAQGAIMALRVASCSAVTWHLALAAMIGGWLAQWAIRVFCALSHGSPESLIAVLAHLLLILVGGGYLVSRKPARERHTNASSMMNLASAMLQPKTILRWPARTHDVAFVIILFVLRSSETYR